MSEYQQHPLSAVFPAMSGEMFGELRADIAANGLNVPITVFEGQILDGWHRFQACQQTGTEPRFAPFHGDEAAARRFVVSANMLRRHLDTSQRALIAARIANLPAHRTIVAGNSVNLRSSSQRAAHDAAALVNIGTKSVEDARVVLNQASPEVVAKVERGELTVSRAAKEIRAATPRPAPQPAAAPAAKAKAKPELPLEAPAPIPKAEPRKIEIAIRTVEQWQALDDEERAAHIAHRNPKASLNAQNPGEDENSIDWAKWTWNPITGCNHNCVYCYARDIATRFTGPTGFPNGFTPTFIPARLSAPLNGRPRLTGDPRDKRIFTGSMTDLFGRWVPREWIEAVLDVARLARDWEFLMLTKFPKRMAEFDIPANVWMGTTVDLQVRVPAAEAAFANVKAGVKWLSIEPLIEPLKFEHLKRFDMIAIGGASASSKTPRWIPPYEWVADLMAQANRAGCAVYLKSNLYLKEAPHERDRYIFTDRAPDVFHYLSRTIVPDQRADTA